MSNTERILRSLRRDRPMTSITLRMPVDVLDDLKRIAPRLGFSGYQPLIRAYVGRGLREDLFRFEGTEVELLVSKLRRIGVDEVLLAKALGEVKRGS